MVVREQFDRIRERHGAYASWAIWTDPAGTPKSNIGDLGILDADANVSLLQTLNKDVIMVGLNISRVFREPFRNFHDPSPKSNDFKIRYAFKNTTYYGAYMTDIIKNVAMVHSTELLEHLRAAPSLVRENVDTFLEELADLGAGKPTILAFGAIAYKLVAENVPADACSRVVKVTHYSHQIGKEKYRQIVLEQAEMG